MTPSQYPTRNDGIIVLSSYTDRVDDTTLKTPSTTITLDTSENWFLSLDVTNSGWTTKDATVSVYLWPNSLNEASSSQARSLYDHPEDMLPIFTCFLPTDGTCGSTFRCHSNYTVPTEPVFYLQTVVYYDLRTVKCPLGKNKSLFGFSYLFSTTEIAVPQTPTSLPTAASSSSNLSRITTGTITSAQKSAPFYVVAFVGATFAALGLFISIARNQAPSEDPSITNSRNKGGYVVELDQVQMIVGSGMLGAAFSSECFLIHLLLTSSDYFTFGLVALSGRLIHIIVAIYIFTMIIISPTGTKKERKEGLYWMKNTEMFDKKEFSLLTLFIFADVTLVRFYPWLDTFHSRRTKGFPSPHVFIMCVYSKLTQGLITIVVQILYLMNLQSNLSDALKQRDSMFVSFNVALTVMLFLVNVFEALSRSGSIYRLAEDDKRQNNLKNSRGKIRRPPTDADTSSFRSSKRLSKSASPVTNPISTFADEYGTARDEENYVGRLSEQRSSLSADSNQPRSSGNVRGSSTAGQSVDPVRMNNSAHTPSFIATRDSIPSLLSPPTRNSAQLLHPRPSGGKVATLQGNDIQGESQTSSGVFESGGEGGVSTHRAHGTAHVSTLLHAKTPTLMQSRFVPPALSLSQIHPPTANATAAAVVEEPRRLKLTTLANHPGGQSAHLSPKIPRGLPFPPNNYL